MFRVPLPPPHDGHLPLSSLYQNDATIHLAPESEVNESSDSHFPFLSPTLLSPPLKGIPRCHLSPSLLPAVIISPLDRWDSFLINLLLAPLTSSRTS